jgi:hypothetical protein
MNEIMDDYSFNKINEIVDPLTILEITNNISDNTDADRFEVAAAIPYLSEEAVITAIKSRRNHMQRISNMLGKNNE